VRPRAALRFSALSDDPAVRPPDPAPAPRPAALRLPLDGVRIADFTAFWAGPYASCVLALLGAEVVHVESPKRPDGMRTRSARPPSDPTWLEWSSIYHANNGSKRAISLDLDCESGLEVARRLVASCDGVIENFSPRVMDGFGLDGAGIARIRADSVCVRMPAFGLDNPWRDRPAFQHTIEPIAGIAWISGYADRDPQPIMICDGLGGVHAAFGMLCGLRHRDRVGEGVHVEVRLSEVAAAIAAEQVVTASARGETMQRIGNRHRWAGPQGVFGCAPDAAEAHHEWVAISVDGDEQWRGLLSVVGAAPGWATLSVPERRLLNDDIEQHLAQWCAARSPSEIVARLSAAGVPVAELSDGAAILQNPQLESRGFFTAHAHPICGSIRYPGLPFTAEMDGVVLPTGHRSYAPMWGEHDDQLAAWIGLDIDDAEQLRSQGVIGRGSTNLGLM
jgi:crotonobetainyl-CoA:carnitine CoA-transferase CaiB-like acyl-CoA transferase